MLPVYIPARKLTLHGPASMQKLLFILNHRNLHTGDGEIVDGKAVVHFNSFEAVRKRLVQWKNSRVAVQRNLWEWIQTHVQIDLILEDVSKTESELRQSYPFSMKFSLDPALCKTLADMIRRST
jgi:hypothetical protein